MWIGFSEPTDRVHAILRPSGDNLTRTRPCHSMSNAYCEGSLAGGVVENARTPRTIATPMARMVTAHGKRDDDGFDAGSSAVPPSACVDFQPSIRGVMEATGRIFFEATAE